MMSFISWSGCNCKLSWLSSIILLWLFVRWYAPLSSVLISLACIHVLWRNIIDQEGWFLFLSRQLPSLLLIWLIMVLAMCQVWILNRVQAALRLKDLWQGDWKRLLELLRQEWSEGKGQTGFLHACSSWMKSGIGPQGLCLEAAFAFKGTPSHPLCGRGVLCLTLLLLARIWAPLEFERYSECVCHFCPGKWE